MRAKTSLWKLTSRAHSADVEGHHGAVEVGRGLGIVGDDHRNRARDLEVVPSPARGRARETFGERVLVELVDTWRVEDGEPAVGDLRGEGDILRTLGREVVGISFRSGCVIDLSGLPRPVPPRNGIW